MSTLISNYFGGMMILAILLYHWVHVKDSNAVHQRYLTSYGNVIGEYYLPHKQAKRFIEACKNSPE